MSVLQQFEDYIKRYQQRLRALATVRGCALLAGVATLITIVAVTIANRAGFPPDLIIAARLVLFVSIAAAAYFFIVRPRRFIVARAAQAIEARTTAFGGRLETYVDMQDSANPLRELLAEDAWTVARERPVDKQVQPGEFALAWLGAGIAVVILLVLAISGPGNFAFGVRQLWVGWAFPGLLPPQSIDVAPGDSGIRMGGNLKIEAIPRGFATKEAVVNVSFGDGNWQQVPMSGGDGAFEFVFFSVREPLQYYVAANNVRSPTFDIAVVDLPIIEKLVLTYRYPDWTGRDPEVRDPGGDVRVVEQTTVEVRVVADRPMTPGELIVDDRAVPLSIAGSSASASFDVSADGQYHVVAAVGGEHIRLTDDYFITAQNDEPPSIEFSRPGRDWSASRIEEVTTQVAAADDFGIESLALRYSVNGDEWREVELAGAGTAADPVHIFFLESLGQTNAATPLEPGDLIAYYVIARDREQSSSTDIFFIDVQPFDRRYSQSQQAGGPMGGQQSGPQNEVSERQREIIISTWNLLREQNDARRGVAYVADNSALLSRLQTTLREQVDSLAERTEARQLTATNEEIATFVAHLQKAAAAMLPAAERLGDIKLESALLPEQEALQHLLAAEAVFTDISVSLQANNRGSGGQAGRDLSDMFELEMDLEKNQYETGSTATPDPPQQQLKETADELAELARRQEQLARNRELQQAQVPAQRWQQQMLRRDAEELRDRLERLSRSAQNDQDGTATAANGSASAGAASPSAAGEPLQRDIDELRRRLDSAVRAISEAGAAMDDKASPADLQRAMQEAQRQLEGARDRANDVQQQAMQAAADDLSRRASGLHESQAGLEQQLQDAVRRVLGMQSDPDRLDSGLSVAEEFKLAADKRALLAEVEALQQDARQLAKDLEQQQPRAAEAIISGVEKLQELQIEARIAVAAAYIEQGEAVYVASSESAVTNGLRGLRDDLADVVDMVAGGAGGTAAAGRGALQDALAQTQELRRALQRLTESDASGRTGVPAGAQRPAGLPGDTVDIGRALDSQADDVSQGVSALLQELADAGRGVREIDALRQLAADIRAAPFSADADLLERESRHTLTLVEQLELMLARSLHRDANGVRATAAAEIPEAYRDIIADYYRRLGNAEVVD